MSCILERRQKRYLPPAWMTAREQTISGIQRSGRVAESSGHENRRMCFCLLDACKVEATRRVLRLSSGMLSGSRALKWPSENPTETYTKATVFLNRVTVNFFLFWVNFFYLLSLYCTGHRRKHCLFVCSAPMSVFTSLGFGFLCREPVCAFFWSDAVWHFSLASPLLVKYANVPRYSGRICAVLFLEDFYPFRWKLNPLKYEKQKPKNLWFKKDVIQKSKGQQITNNQHPQNCDYKIIWIGQFGRLTFYVPDKHKRNGGGISLNKNQSAESQTCVAPACISQPHGERWAPHDKHPRPLALAVFRRKYPERTHHTKNNNKKKHRGDYNFSQSSFKLNQMKQGPALFSIIRTHEEQHDNTGIHANSWFWDQSAQMASWQLAYCWIIHPLHQAGKRTSMGPGYSAFFPCPGLCCQKTNYDKNVTSKMKGKSFLITCLFPHKLNWRFNSTSVCKFWAFHSN